MLLSMLSYPNASPIQILFLGTQIWINEVPLCTIFRVHIIEWWCPMQIYPHSIYYNCYTVVVTEEAVFDNATPVYF
jgi:hypothetical protein